LSDELPGAIEIFLIVTSAWADLFSVCVSEVALLVVSSLGASFSFVASFDASGTLFVSSELELF
jgi:hypothetical protein